MLSVQLHNVFFLGAQQRYEEDKILMVFRLNFLHFQVTFLLHSSSLLSVSFSSQQHTQGGTGTERHVKNSIGKLTDTRNTYMMNGEQAPCLCASIHIHGTCIIHNPVGRPFNGLPSGRHRQLEVHL